MKKTRDYPFFPDYEVTCHCGCGNNRVSPRFMRKLIAARTDAEIPFSMNRICSCPGHNAKIGGSPTSSHISTSGKMACAGDIACSDSACRGIIVTALIKAGFRRIGIAKTFIHVDDDPKKPECIWLYD